MTTMHVASMATGLSEADALRHALTAMHADRSVSMFDNIEDAIRGELADAKTAGDTAKAAELARLGFKITGQFTSGGCLPVQLEHFAVNFRLEMLGALPGDAQIDSSGFSVALRFDFVRTRATMETNDKRINQDPGAAALLAAASEPVMREYFKVYTQSGQRAALRVLLDTEAAKKPGP
jgi:hypothetical protein